MKKLLIALSIIFTIYACSSGEHKQGSNLESLSRPALNSTIDLRLGQLSSNASPVAVPAALQNGESVVVFADSADNDFKAVFVSPNSETLLTTFDSSGKPKSAQSEDILFSFTNYKKNDELDITTVDITITLNETSRKARTISLSNQPINQNVLDFINGDVFLKILLGVDQDIDSSIRELLAAAIGALRLIGCGSEEFINATKNLIPENLFSGICNPNLLGETENILESSNYGAILVNLTNRHPECDNLSDYEQLSACALVIWEELIQAAEQKIVGDFPNIEDDNGGTKNDFFGGWSGQSITSTCSNFTVSFQILSSISGDSSCKDSRNPCIATGTFFGEAPSAPNNPGFPMGSSPRGLPLTGEVFIDDTGEPKIALKAVESRGPTSRLEFVSRGIIINNKKITGAKFDVNLCDDFNRNCTPISCAGTANYNKLRISVD